MNILQIWIRFFCMCCYLQLYMGSSRRRFRNIGSCRLYVRQMYTRSSFEVLIDYNTYVWIAQLFILGLVVGYMRDQIRIMRLESQELEEHLHRQIVDIRDNHER